MAVIDFDAARRERQAKTDPITFRLGGETFTVRRLITLGEAWVDKLPPAPERFEAAEAESFLLLAQTIAGVYLDPEDRERWWSIFDDPARGVEGDDLLEVIARLSEEVTGRPLSPPPASANGRKAKTNGSTSSSTPAATSDRPSSTRRTGKGSRGSNGRRTTPPALKAGRTSATGSRGTTPS